MSTDESNIEDLIEKTKNKDLRIRSKAIKSLLLIKDIKAFDTLNNLLYTAHDSRIRDILNYELPKYLINCKDEEILFRALEGNNKLFEQPAIFGLSKLGNKKALKKLKKIIMNKKNDVNIRYQALEIYIKTDQTNADKCINKILCRRNEDKRFFKNTIDKFLIINQSFNNVSIGLLKNVINFLDIDDSALEDMDNYKREKIRTLQNGLIKGIGESEDHKVTQLLIGLLNCKEYLFRANVIDKLCEIGKLEVVDALVKECEECEKTASHHSFYTYLEKLVTFLEKYNDRIPSSTLNDLVKLKNKTQIYEEVIHERKIRERKQKYDIVEHEWRDTNEFEERIEKETQKTRDVYSYAKVRNRAIKELERRKLT